MKALAAVPFFHGECVNLAISQQQLQLFIMHSKFFQIARMTFGTVTFSKELLFRSTYSFNSL